MSLFDDDKPKKGCPCGDEAILADTERFETPLCYACFEKALKAVEREQARLVDPQYPFYPHLSEAGAEEAQKLVDAFRTRIQKVLKDELEQVLGELYVDIVPHISSDSWTNYRNALMDGFRGYTQNRLTHMEYEFKQIREKIFSEHREAIMADINLDNLKKIEELQKRNSELSEMLREERSYR